MNQILQTNNVKDVRKSLLRIVESYTLDCTITQKYIICNNYVFFELEDYYYIIYDRINNDQELVNGIELEVFLHNLYS